MWPEHVLWDSLNYRTYITKINQSLNHNGWIIDQMQDTILIHSLFLICGMYVTTFKYFFFKATIGFTIRSMKGGLCLEDSSGGVVELRTCSLDSVLQQWKWTDHWFLVNTGTLRCLSAVHTDPVQTIACDSGEHIKWQCKAQQLTGLQNSLALSTERAKLRLSSGEHDTWKSLDEGDICQNKRSE